MGSFSAFWFLILLHSIDFTSAQSNSNSGNSDLFIGQYPIPSKTPIPLNIDTNKVKSATLPLMRFTAEVGTNAKIINDGNAVKFIAYQGAPGTTVTGGPLFNDIYNFHVATYYWSGNSSGFAATVVDGADGSPIEAISYWYNKKYGSFENSKNFRDGMAAITFPAEIGPLSSTTFTPFEEKLKEIRKSGSYVITNYVKAFIWLDNYAAAPNSTYFSYPGSYTDRESLKEYNCATVITFRQKINFISQEQFDNSFLSLENSKRENFINVAPNYPQDDVPVIQAEGEVQIFIPLGKHLSDVAT